MKILCVIDMQNDFVNGTLGTKEAEAIVANVVKKIEEYERYASSEDVYIIATRDTHHNDYLDTQEGRKLPVSHCIKNTEGWQLHEKVTEALLHCGMANVYGIDKPTFGSVELAEKIRGLGRKEAVEKELAKRLEISVEIVGLCTDICVVSNALLIKAVNPEIPLKVDASCCAGTTPEAHAAALRVMESCQVEISNDRQKQELKEEEGEYENDR